MSSPLYGIEGWEVRHLAALVKTVGGPETARRLLTCGKVTVTFDEGSKEATVAAVAPKRKNVLGQAGTVQFPECTDAFDPRAFYQTRSGLYVWDEFCQRVVATAKPVASLPAMEGAYFDLIKDANDAAIRRELPAEHVFEDASEFCARLAGLLKRQAGGVEGDLVANGYANIFCVRGVTGGVFAVSVYWFFDGRGWGVSAYQLVGGGWSAGCRAFSRNH
jgi:hypothetical protein